MTNQSLQFNREQAERLAELGDRLRHYRQKQNLSLQTIAEKTLIPVRLLVAIEDGKLDQLPEPVYVQGFIRRYADAIGLDGAEFASIFPAQLPLRMSRPSWRKSIQAQLRPLHLYVIYLLLVMGSVSSLSYVLSRSTQPMVSMVPSQPGQSTKTGPQTPSASPSPGAIAPQTPSSPSVAQKPVRISLTLIAQSWIEVVVDGKPAFEDTLPEGSQRTWVADKQLKLRAGNAGGVIVTFNDGQAKPLGPPGSVEEVTFGSNPQSHDAANSADNPILTASRARASHEEAR
jgi:cytoskeletal protein RodZ